MTGFFASLMVSPSSEMVIGYDENPEDVSPVCGEQPPPERTTVGDMTIWFSLPNRDPVLEICLVADGEIVRCLPADKKKLFRGRRWND